MRRRGGLDASQACIGSELPLLRTGLLLVITNEMAPEDLRDGLAQNGWGENQGLILIEEVVRAVSSRLIR